MAPPLSPRVLLIAEAANPEWVSSALIGWSTSRAIAAQTPTHLATQVRNREALTKRGLVEGEDFTAFDNEVIAGRLYRLGARMRGKSGEGWTTMTALAPIAYYEFERLVWRRFADDLRAGRFDVVHRVTPVSPAIPSRIARRCARIGVPFVVGPLNGGLPWPKGFEHLRRKSREWLSYARAAHRLLPGYGSMRRSAKAILVASRSTLDEVPRRYRDKCIYVPENAIDPERFGAFRDGPVTHPIRIAFVGRLVPIKGCDMLLDAAAPLLQGGRIELDFFGDGPELPRLKELARRHRAEHAVRFHGWVEHVELQKGLAQCDAFGFASVRDFGGGALLEAMATGLAPVVLDVGGPAELLTDDTGYLVEFGSRDEIIAGFRARFDEMLEAPDEVRATGQRARTRVLEHFTWDAKARQHLEVYRWVLGHQEKKPDFGMPIGESLFPIKTRRDREEPDAVSVPSGSRRLSS